MRLSSLPSARTTTSILVVLFISLSSFYVGVSIGIHAASCDCREQEETPHLSDKALQRKVEELARQKVKSQLVELCETLSPGTISDEPKASPSRNDGGSPLFSKSLSHFAQGLARVSKVDLMETYDFGVPMNADSEGLDALILYNKKEALPSNKDIARMARHEDPTKPLPLLSAETATENCDAMNVVLINNPGNTRQCFALVGGQYQSYHVQRWLRRPDHGSAPLNPNLSLKLSSRSWEASGRQLFVPPSKHHVEQHQKRLLTYLTESENIKSRLRQTLKKHESKTVIILTCNLGQSELLLNFACSARARGFDLKNVVVFLRIDERVGGGYGTCDIYEEKLMASIPKEQAAQYGDTVFSSVMFAKVLCVQLVNELGYDLLFQDVDVVWYKSPLDFFHDKALPVFDMYFQDDGSRSLRRGIYSDNSFTHLT
ncbi:LOW QUALITY PROTEIN: hypothetical protein ACHAW5_001650 [Stephanodiscus triporus]|uniref:Nucleotide-diphospho-sugar transferase domain-containing protein n=1 Tax=Stephanodiscus triporus TaxID=2934178 RepID=A0ABD3PZW8_9STRA